MPTQTWTCPPPQQLALAQHGDTQNWTLYTHSRSPNIHTPGPGTITPRGTICPHTQEMFPFTLRWRQADYLQSCSSREDQHHGPRPDGLGLICYMQGTSSVALCQVHWSYRQKKRMAIVNYSSDCWYLNASTGCEAADFCSAIHFPKVFVVSYINVFEKGLLPPFCAHAGMDGCVVPALSAASNTESLFTKLIILEICKVK